MLNFETVKTIKCKELKWTSVQYIPSTPYLFNEDEKTNLEFAEFKYNSYLIRNLEPSNIENTESFTGLYDRNTQKIPECRNPSIPFNEKYYMIRDRLEMFKREDDDSIVCLGKLKLDQ